MIEETEDVGDLINDAVFGQRVGEFLNTDIGKYLVRKAETDAEKGVENLKRCPPEDANAIRKYQSDIQRAESIQQWLGEAIARGLKALEILDDRE